MAKLGDLRNDFSKWEEVSRGADFPADKPSRVT
jgi:hypothetical protein